MFSLRGRGRSDDEGSGGGKEFDPEAGVWKVDGEPVTYRVTWTTIDSHEQHTEEFSDIDHGYDRYQDLQRAAYAYNVTWEHLPY